MLVLVGLSSAAACTGDQVKWTEEVELHDGKTVRLKRRTELTVTGFPVQRDGVPKYHEFCYLPLGIHWKSKAEYRPEVFDVVGDKAYSKVSLGSDCTRCMLHGYPETDALYFRWERSSGWQKIAFKEYPSQLFRLNLLMSVPGKAATDAPVITVTQKENMNPSLHYILKKTGARGLNELAERRGACAKCRAISIRTNSTAEVFLPLGTKKCEW
jgi:hypothetical protein